MGRKTTRRTRRPALEELGPRVAPFTLLGAAPWPLGADGFVRLTFGVGSLDDGGLSGVRSPAAIHGDVIAALSLWAAAAPLHFVEVPEGGDLLFSRAELFGDVIGQAYAPGPARGGDVEIGNGRPWGDGSGGGGTLSLYQVLTHEVGHALGLGHEPLPPQGDRAVMNPVLPAGVFGGSLFPDDVAGIRALYGDGVGSVFALAGPEEEPPCAFAQDDGTVAVRGFRGVLLMRLVPFPGYAGGVSLSYDGEEGTLGATADDNGHAVRFGPDGGLLESVLAAPPRAMPNNPYPGYEGRVERTAAGDTLPVVTLAREGGHVKAFSGSGEVASFLAFEGHAGEVRLGAGQGGTFYAAARTPEGGVHVKGFDAQRGGFFALTHSFIRTTEERTTW